MSDKRKKQKFAAKRKAREHKQLAEDGEWKAAKGLRGANLPVDSSQQVPGNSLSAPHTFYVDVEFICRDCGANEVWTAAQQKWYYEVAKGSVYGRAVRCRECRRKIREQKAIQRQQMAAAEARNQATDRQTAPRDDVQA